MMVTVYVDWENHEILTEEQFEEEVSGFVENIKDDASEVNSRLYYFLERKEIDQVDLFNMSETERIRLHHEFEEWLVEDAREQLLEEEYDKVKLEL